MASDAVAAARALARSGHIAEAADAFERAGAEPPYPTEAWLGAAEAALRLEQPERAAGSALRALALDPAHHAGHDTLARAAMRLRHADIAAAASDRLLDLAPDLPRALALKAGVIVNLRDHKQFDRAARLVERAAATEPPTPYAVKVADRLRRMRGYLAMDRHHRAHPSPSAPPAASAGSADGLAQHLAQRIRAARVVHHPFSHFQIADVFPDAIYRDMIALRPPPEVETPGAGPEYRERRSFAFDRLAARDPERAAFWATIHSAVESSTVLAAFVDAFGATELVEVAAGFGLAFGTDARLIRDRSGYALGPHKDHFSRFGSIVFNLPADEDARDLGTALYARLSQGERFDNGQHYAFDGFKLVGRADFLPNTAFGFLNFGEAYHGVAPIAGAPGRSTERWNLQYTIRLD